jgi:hypothetical protein
VTAPPRESWQDRKLARARAELAAAELLARGPIQPPADELARVTWLLTTAPWVFAKTMPENPHWYTLRRRWENDGDFVFVVQFIRRHGLVERFPDPQRGWPYIYLDLDGFHYWTMGARCERGPYGDWPEDETLINRKPLSKE